MLLLFLMLPQLPRSTLFPYTTLFRSRRAPAAGGPAGRRQDAAGPQPRRLDRRPLDRKSTRLNSSHPSISYAVFCLKKKNLIQTSAVLDLTEDDFEFLTIN